MTDATTTTVPEVGTRVQYMLSQFDADQINSLHTEHNNYLRSGLAHVLRTGHVGHLGNHASAGDIVAADIVRVFNETTTTANLQLVLDGNHGAWVTSRSHGFTEGKWRYLGETEPAPAAAETQQTPATA